MLHKLLIICLFTTTYMMIAMDAPSNYQTLKILTGKSDIAEKAIAGAQERYKIFESDSTSCEKPAAPWEDEAKSNFIKMLFEFSPIDSLGNTALHYAAAMLEVPDLVTLMFNQKPELKSLIDHYNNQGMTPLLLALEKENIKAALALIHYGANVELCGKNTALNPSK